jgi:hypothetical protein
MKVFAFLLFFSFTALCHAQSTIAKEIDTYFKQVDFDWEKVHGHFLTQLEEWGLNMEEGDFNTQLNYFFANFDQTVAPIEKTKSTDKIVAELEKLGDFYPTGEVSLEKPATAWWHDLLKKIDETALYNPEVFRFLKERSVHGTIHPSTIAATFSIGFTADQLKDTGLQKLSICLLYPFLLPSPANLAGLKAEKELKELLTPMLEEMDWDAFEEDLLNYIKKIPGYAETKFQRKGDKIHYMYNYIGASNRFIAMRADAIEVIDTEGYIDGFTPDFTKIAEMLKPIVDNNPALHQLHPIKGAYLMAADIEDAGPISPAIVGRACTMNWNEVVIEEPHYLLLSIMFLSTVVLK